MVSLKLNCNTPFVMPVVSLLFVSLPATPLWHDASNIDIEASTRLHRRWVGHPCRFLLERILTNAHCTPYRLWKMGKRPSPECPYCKAEEADVQHFLFHCPYFHQLRQDAPDFISYSEHWPTCVRQCLVCTYDISSSLRKRWHELQEWGARLFALWNHVERECNASEREGGAPLAPLLLLFLLCKLLTFLFLLLPLMIAPLTLGWGCSGLRLAIALSGPRGVVLPLFLLRFSSFGLCGRLLLPRKPDSVRGRKRFSSIFLLPGMMPSPLGMLPFLRPFTFLKLSRLNFELGLVLSGLLSSLAFDGTQNYLLTFLFVVFCLLLPLMLSSLTLWACFKLMPLLPPGLLSRIFTSKCFDLMCPGPSRLHLGHDFFRDITRRNRAKTRACSW